MRSNERRLKTAAKTVSLLIVTAVLVVALTPGLAASAASTVSLMRKATDSFLTGDFAVASELYTELLDRELTYIQLREALLSLCESRLREGKLAEAESVAVLASQKVSDVPGLERLGFLRGETYYFSGRVEEAVDEYLDFLAVNPESPRVNDVIARLLVLDENGDYGRVPLTAFAHAEFLWFAGLRDSAMGVLDTLLALFPDAQIADDALMSKGDILLEQKKFQDSIAQYDSLEMRFSGSHLVPVCKLKVAGVYVEQLKDEEKAIAEYEEIVTNFPETSFAVEARYQLQKLRGR